MSVANAPIPLMLLTGFLGSGKTTLLNALLRHRDFGGTAVLVNEIGTIGIDHNLVIGASDDVLLLEGGCICCQPKGSVPEAVTQLLSMNPPPKRIVIETSGAANPVSVLEALCQHPQISKKTNFPRVVTVLDCVLGQTTLAQHMEARVQLSTADIVILSKADIATKADRSEVNDIIARTNPTAVLVHGKGDALPDDFAELLSQPVDRLTYQPRSPGRPTAHVHGSTEFQTVGLQFDGCLEAATVQDWLDEVLELYGSNVLRIKGILNLKDYKQPAVLQCVRDMVHPIELLEVQPEQTKSNNIVAIGWDMHPELLNEALGWLAERAEQSTLL